MEPYGDNKKIVNHKIEDYHYDPNSSNDEKLIPEVNIQTDIAEHFNQFPLLEQGTDLDYGYDQQFDQLPLPLPTFEEDPSLESAIFQQLDQLPPVDSKEGLKARFEVANQLDQLQSLDKPPAAQLVSENVDIADPSLYQSQILYY